MEAVPFTFNHLDQYNIWLTKWNIKILPPDFYPIKGGFIVENHCAAFIYLTNTAIAFCESIVVNPESNDNDRKTSMDILHEALNNFAINNNVKLIIGKSFNESLLNRCQEVGWRISKKQYNMMYKTIGEN
jgi:hypothetical protein